MILRTSSILIKKKSYGKRKPFSITFSLWCRGPRCRDFILAVLKRNGAWVQLSRWVHKLSIVTLERSGWNCARSKGLVTLTKCHARPKLQEDVKEVTMPTVSLHAYLRSTSLHATVEHEPKNNSETHGLIMFDCKKNAEIALWSWLANKSNNGCFGI